MIGCDLIDLNDLYNLNNLKNNIEEIDKVYDEIKNIYYETKNKMTKDDKNVLEVNKIINSFTTEHIYEYFYEIIIRNAKLGLTPL